MFFIKVFSVLVQIIHGAQQLTMSGKYVDKTPKRKKTLSVNEKK